MSSTGKTCYFEGGLCSGYVIAGIWGVEYHIPIDMWGHYVKYRRTERLCDGLPVYEFKADSRWIGLHM